MKTTSMLILFVCVVATFFAPSTLLAVPADTVIVAALPPGNLNTVINSDTASGGALRPNTVYLLKPTGALDTVYYLSAPIAVKGNLHIVGYVNPVTGHPPVIAPSIAEDNSSIYYFFNPQSADTLSLEGLYFLGTRTDTMTLGGRFVLPTGDSNVFIFDHCILENISGTGTPNLFDTWDHDHMSFYVTNCEFRNNQDDTPQNPGFAWIDPGTYPCDTAIFRNNTFFLTGGYVLGSSGFGARYLEFDHNTIFVSGQGGAFDLYQMTNTVIKNNIFYGVSAAGYPTSWASHAGTWGLSVIPIDTLSTLKADPYYLTEADRHITIANNAYFWPPVIVNNWTALNAGVMSSDNLLAPVFLSLNGAMGTDKTTWPYITIANNDSVDPGFNSTIVGLAAGNMAAFVDTFWTDSQSGNGVRPYVYSLYNPPTVSSSDWPNVSSTWASVQGYPVPENLAYSSTLLGADGLALGDLNWYPSQLAQYKPTAVKVADTEVPGTYNLSQNYPNPFNPTTQIEFTLPKASNVQVKVFNTIGQEVATLADGMLSAGSHMVTFNAKNLASGMYFYRLTAGQFTSVKKMMLVK